MQSKIEARVQLLNQPMLSKLTRKAVEEWDDQYSQYVERVKAQGLEATPTTKLACVEFKVKRLIALRLGKKVKTLTQEEVGQSIDDCRRKDGNKTMDNSTSCSSML